jgi:hypothetical protein
VAGSTGFDPCGDIRRGGAQSSSRFSRALSLPYVLDGAEPELAAVVAGDPGTPIERPRCALFTGGARGEPRQALRIGDEV